MSRDCRVGSSGDAWARIYFFEAFKLVRSVLFTCMHFGKLNFSTRNVEVTIVEH